MSVKYLIDSRNKDGGVVWHLGVLLGPGFVSSGHTYHDMCSSQKEQNCTKKEVESESSRRKMYGQINHGLWCVN